MSESWLQALVMADGMPSDALEGAEIRTAFPGWNVWRSDAGCWWATRLRPLPPSQWPSRYALTVTADDAHALGEQIARQPG